MKCQTSEKIIAAHQRNAQSAKDADNAGNEEDLESTDPDSESSSDETSVASKSGASVRSRSHTSLPQTDADKVNKPYYTFRHMIDMNR